MNAKIINYVASFVLIAFSHASYADEREERLNGREAAEVCKQEITYTYASENDVRFSQRSASSLKYGAYTFWINATEEIEGKRDSVKYQCEITRNGELVELTREAGRWNI